MSSTSGDVSVGGQNLRHAFAVFAVMTFALFIRSLGFEHVFTDEGVVFAPADATYHMRRAFYTFANFPELLLRDPYLNFPGGVNVPWPPLFDFIVGGTARIFAEDQAGFERIAAWASSVFGALTVVPIYFIARQVSSHAVGLFAGFLFSLFPMCVKYGRVGNPDHHTAVALVGACMLLLCTYVARRDVDDRRIMLMTPFMFFARLSMFLIWHGNLLYLMFFEAALLLTAAATRRSSITRAQALSAIFTAVVLSPIVEEFLPVPIGGPYSSISLSRLHILVMVGTSFVAFAHWGLNLRRPESGFVLRLFAIGGASLVFVALLAAVPATREGLIPALQFLTLRDGAGAGTIEQFPLFAIFGRDPVYSPEQPWAYFAYLIPAAPLAFPFFVRDPERRASAWVLTGWTAGFALLAMMQRRYGNDFAPGAAVAFAILLVGVPRAIIARQTDPPRLALHAASLTSLTIALFLFSPALRNYEIPRIQSGFAALRGKDYPPPKGTDLISKNVAHFARKIRSATPDTEGFFNQRRNPEYAVIAHANLGHLLHYHARRATATDPMWSYIGPKNWALSRAFFSATDEAQSLKIANHLKGRYLVTGNTDPKETVSGRLHQFDGRPVSGSKRLERFRLLAESAPGRVGLGVLYEPKPGDESANSVNAYKLFEIVQGAVIEVIAEPNSRVTAAVTIESPSGRHFNYSANATTNDSGIARMRVPYSTGSTSPVHATGPYRISSGFQIARVDVDDAEVRNGSTVPITLGVGFESFP